MSSGHTRTHPDHLDETAANMHQAAGEVETATGEFDGKMAGANYGGGTTAELIHGVVTGVGTAVGGSPEGAGGKVAKHKHDYADNISRHAANSRQNEADIKADLEKRAKALAERKSPASPGAQSGSASTSGNRSGSRIGDALGGAGTPPTPRRRRSPKLPPKDTPEGKAARWDRYQKRVQSNGFQEGVRNGKRPALDYPAWSNVYDANIKQHDIAAAAVDDYASRNGLTKDKGYVQEHPVPVGDKTRRIDIAHPGRAEGYEYKNGSVPNDDKLHAEITHDTALMRRGWNMTWVFRKQPPSWLSDKLTTAGIPWALDSGGTPQP